MGVDTKAILRKDVSLREIVEVLEAEYGNVEVDGTYIKDYFTVRFDDGEVMRMLHVMFGDVALHDYQIDGVLLSLGFFGNAKEIMMTLLNEFGGYIDENDSDDKGFEPVNISEFEKAVNKTQNARDILVNKIISKIGYDKLDVTLDLIDEYVSMIGNSPSSEENLLNKDK